MISSSRYLFCLQTIYNRWEVVWPEHGPEMFRKLFTMRRTLLEACHVHTHDISPATVFIYPVLPKHTMSSGNLSIFLTLLPINHNCDADLRICLKPMDPDLDLACRVPPHRKKAPWLHPPPKMQGRCPEHPSPPNLPNTSPSLLSLEWQGMQHWQQTQVIWTLAASGSWLRGLWGADSALHCDPRSLGL